MNVSAEPGSVATAAHVTSLPARTFVASGVSDTIEGATFADDHVNVSVTVPPSPSDAVTVTEPFPSSDGTYVHDHVLWP